MNNYIFILAAVMLLAGVFGGMVNFYLTSQTEKDAENLPKYLVVGIGAAFLVPVLLDIVSSDLIIESQGDPSRMLIFTGFCLIASLLSRIVINTSSDKILTEVQYARQTSEGLQYDLKRLQNELIPLIETETEQDELMEDATLFVGPEEELDVTSTKVLKTLGGGRYIFRSIIGLCRESSSDEYTVNKTLGVLSSKSLAGKVSSKKGLRWYITEKGRRVLEAL